MISPWGSNALQKADIDFSKRLETTPPDVRSKNTFVFATPRRWGESEDWRQQKRQDNHWKDVKVITSDQLEKWYELVPWVANDFLREQLKRRGRGPITLREIWKDYKYSQFDGNLKPQFVIAGRKDHAKKLAGWIERSGPEKLRALRLYGRSQVEVMHFLAACIAEMSEAQREFSFQRTLLAEDKDSVIAIRRLHADCVLVTPEGEHVAAANAAAAQYGCKTIICCVGNAPNALPANPGYTIFTLDDATSNDLIQSVIGCGYSAHDATRICAECDFNYVKIRQEIFKC
jgi:hypothetical protein